MVSLCAGCEKGGQNISFQGLSDSPVFFLSPITATRSMIWRSFVSPPTSTWWEISTERLRRTGKSVNIFTLTYKRGVQWAWINRLDVAERAITQDEGLGKAEGLRCHFCSSFLFLFFLFHIPGPRSIATDLKPIGQVLLNKSDVSSHPGTGHVCLLGLERPSNITQPFDLLTPAGSFSPAVMDDV